jgi:hypothetical protein
VRALTEGQYDRLAECLGRLDSLDTDGCSDMFKFPEKAESNRDFGPSTRWWMRPRKRRLGMKRTHLADPSGTWTASDPRFSGSHPGGLEASCARDWRRLHERLDGSAAGNFATSGTAASFRGPRQSDLEQLLRRDKSRNEACSSDGTSLADLITQMVPRLGMGPLNREGARR